MIHWIEKAYDEVEKNQPHMHENLLYYTRYSIVQKFSNKQSAKVGLIDLEQHTARDN